MEKEESEAKGKKKSLRETSHESFRINSLFIILNHTMKKRFDNL